MVGERLGLVPDQLPGGHLLALSRPRELADRLEGYLRELEAATTPSRTNEPAEP